MKYLLLFLVAFPIRPWAACTDLSNRQVETNGISIYMTQAGCDSIQDQQFVNGNAFGVPTIYPIDGQWHNQHVEDEHEVSDIRNRWRWNSDGSAIISDYSYDTLNDKDKGGSSVFTSVTVIKKNTDGKISFQVSMQNSIEAKDSSVGVNQSQVNDVRDPL